MQNYICNQAALQELAVLKLRLKFLFSFEKEELGKSNAKSIAWIKSGSTGCHLGWVREDLNDFQMSKLVQMNTTLCV